MQIADWWFIARRDWVLRHCPPPNKSLQRTFDPPPIFAAAKTGVASNAAELRRYVYPSSFINMDRG
jgi:hypothetical protein